MKTKDNSILQKVAAVLAFAIGAMAVFAGGNVLLGNLPDYYVVAWLPTYNLLMGSVSVFFSAIVIWKTINLPCLQLSGRLASMPSSCSACRQHAAGWMPPTA